MVAIFAYSCTNDDKQIHNFYHGMEPSLVFEKYYKATVFVQYCAKGILLNFVNRCLHDFCT